MHIFITTLNNEEIIAHSNNLMLYNETKETITQNITHFNINNIFDPDEDRTRMNQEVTPTITTQTTHYYAKVFNSTAEISQKEYQRIKSILKLLNKDTIKEIEATISNQNLKSELKTHLNSLLRIELEE